MIKNKTYIMSLKQYRVFGIDDAIVYILEFENESKNKHLTGLLIEDFNSKESVVKNISINTKYNISGNLINLDNDNFKELDVIIDEKKTLREYINTSEVFQVLSIKEEKENPRIKSVSLSMYYNDHSNDRVEISIPIEAIDNLRVGHISNDIEYLKDGKYVDFTNCDDFDLKIDKDKIRKKDIDILLDNITIFSVGLFLDNGEANYYNMPFCSDDGIHNKFQEILSNKERIEIVFDGRYKK